MEQLGLNQILQNQFNHSNLNNNEGFNRYNNYIQNINSQNTENIFSIINNENMDENNNSNEIIENIENRFDFDSFENINNIENVYEPNLNNQNLYESNNEISDNNSNIDIDSSNQEDTSTVNSCDINISNNNSLFIKQKTDSPSHLKSKISMNLIYNDNYQKRRKSMDLIPFNKFYTFKKSYQFKILESTYYNTNKLNMIKTQGKFDFESEEGNEICKECLQNIENLIKSLKVKISNRDYRKKFTKAYIFLYQEDSLCYLTEILDSAQEATPDLLVNGEKYIFSKEVIERGNQLFVSFCSLIMLISEVVNIFYDEIIIEDDKLNIMINDLKNCLFEFDKKWTLYEEKYIMELIYIEKISRRYIFEGIKLEKELSLYEKRANIKGKNICENDKEYNNIRDKFIKVINYLNKIANINGKGRDDLDISILLQSEKVLRTVTEVQSNGLRKLANNIKKTLNDLRNLFRKYNLNIEGVDPQLLNNPELVSNLYNFEQIWEKGKNYLCNQKKYNYLMGFNKIIEIINEKYKGKDISSLIEESDPKIIVIIPAILILKAIDSNNYEIINNFIPNIKKDKLFISIKGTIRNVYKKVKDPYYAYNLFEKLLLFNEGKDENSINKEMEKYLKNEEITKFIKNIKILSINMQRDNPSEWNEFFQLAMAI